MASEVTELKSGKQRRETVFAITSPTAAQADPHELLQLNRGQWGIENRSHYMRVDGTVGPITCALRGEAQELNLVVFSRWWGDGPATRTATRAGTL